MSPINVCTRILYMYLLEEILKPMYNTMMRRSSHQISSKPSGIWTVVGRPTKKCFSKNVTTGPNILLYIKNQKRLSCGQTIIRYLPSFSFHPWPKYYQHFLESWDFSYCRYLFLRESTWIFTGQVTTINAPLILKVLDCIFFIWAKHIFSHFSGFFMGIKMVDISMKNPEKWLNICFAQIKTKIQSQTFRNRRALVFFSPVSYIHAVGILKAKKSRSLWKTPQNGRLCRYSTV